MRGSPITRTLVPLLFAVLAVVSTAGAADGPVDAKLERLEGGKVRLSELRGAPVLLELWATWCQPCVEQAEIVEGLEQELADRGVSVLTVDVGETRDVVEAYVVDHPKRFPVVLDRSQVVARRLDVGELPALVLLRADGTTAGLRLGLTDRDELLAFLDSVR